MPPEIQPQTEKKPGRVAAKPALYAAMVALVLLGVLRSAITTRFDSFTVDENYHITAGVTYVRMGDYRVNPEHPPLTKLWVGAMIYSDFVLPPLQIFNDKMGERNYAAQTVFLRNDPDRVQRRSRIAMYVFNGVLLLLFGVVAARVFGPWVGLGALAFLVIDPTVAAHMPVVMTDLPVTLLGGISLLLAWIAFHTWRLRDVVLAGIALGLTLATKHSGILFAEFVGAAGLYFAFRRIEGRLPITRRRRSALICVVLVGSLAVLWSTYRFRYTESGVSQETFNRPLDGKIQDLVSSHHRFVLSAFSRYHIFPRAYIWGLADIVRAGVEGRGYPVFFMGRMYYEHKPIYFFPVQILIKVPLGLILLAFAGVVVLLVRKAAPACGAPLLFLSCFAMFFLLTLAVSNSFYAGVRHALPIYPALAVFCGLGLATLLADPLLLFRTASVGSLAWALISSVPMLRPWEYHNELAGGSANAYRNFSDEGIDLGLRVKDLAKYYHERLAPKGELPLYIDYLSSPEELLARGVRTIDQKWRSGEIRDDSDIFEGTVIVEAIKLSPDPDSGLESFLQMEPSERKGNLLIFRGSFYLPKARASRIYNRALDVLFSENGGPARAEPMFDQVTALNPDAYYAWIELGNLRAQRGAREEAIAAFENALKGATLGAELRQGILHEIELLKTAKE
ncbi:MAG TPA: hypothetical protein VLX32_03630, partial [Candidatus Acidoferrum sp.]|nr:hypothetical protein [Candidatus Acidoferrum sp.]